MLPSTQPIAIDLSGGSLQVSDSVANNPGSAEPDGDFATLLLSPAGTDGAGTEANAGSGLPQAGSELPMQSVPVPTEQVPMDTLATELVAFYEGDQALATAPVTAASALTDADSVADLAEIAPPANVGLRIDPRTGDTGRSDSRLQLRALSDERFARRDHGRMPFTQPMAPPDRLIFNTSAGGADAATMTDNNGMLAGRLSATAEADLVSIEQRGLGERMPGLPAGEQAGRGTGEMAMTMDLSVRNDGGETLPRSTTTVQGAAAAAQLADPGQVRDLAGAAKPAPMLTTTIDRPVMDDAWGEAFQDRVLWMAKGKIQNAEIRLNPAELGPIRIQVSVEDDAAMLQFTAQHSATREAIEQALPRLRDMLSENGLTLAESSVDDSADGQQNDPDGESASGTAAENERSGADSGDPVARPARLADTTSLVDTFV